MSKTTIKEFLVTPAGKVTKNGAAFIAYQLLVGLLLKKFNPVKATFGTAMAMGIYATAMNTIVAAGNVRLQEMRTEKAEKNYAGCREHMSNVVAEYAEEIKRLHRRIGELQDTIGDDARKVSEERKLVKNFLNKLAQMAEPLEGDL